MTLSHWTKRDVAELTELATDLIHENYCSNCSMVRVSYSWEYCSGCVEEIVEYLEKDNRRYLRAIALKEESFHFEG